jgi:peptidoglycan/xylan/chitin deacetylase (PgdA/CDA1 family)
MKGKRQILAEAFATSGLTRLLEAVLRRDALLVINYHRIGNAEDTPYDSGTFGPTAEQFDWEMGYVKSRFDCVSLEEALAMMTRVVPVRSSLLITFDDGNIDNYQTAFPILRSHGLHATFFLPTAFIGTQRLPWWDTIAYIVKHSRNDIFKIHYPEPAEFRLDRRRPSVTVFQVLRFCSDRATTNYTPLIDELESVCDCERPNGSSERCFLNWDEVREMQAGGMSFGSHTHNHEVLSGLTLEGQRSELRDSRAIMERELGRTVDILAYPVGRPYTFNAETWKALEDCGYRAAFSFYGGANVNGNVNRLDIRRQDCHSPSTSLFRLQTTLGAVGKSLPSS